MENEEEKNVAEESLLGKRIIRVEEKVTHNIFKIEQKVASPMAPKRQKIFHLE